MRERTPSRRTRPTAATELVGCMRPTLSGDSMGGSAVRAPSAKGSGRSCSTGSRSGTCRCRPASGSPHAERVINADPDAGYGLTPVARDAWGHENFDYVADALHDPLTVRSMLEDYRAGIGVDADHDRATRREHGKISRPMLVAWSVRDDLEQLHANPADIWRAWSTEVITTARIDSGHHMADENPHQVTAALDAFARSCA